MSTRIGIVTEGSIDDVLLPPLIEAVAQKRAGISWPVHAEDAAEILQTRKRGHGGLHIAVDALVRLDDAGELSRFSFFVVLLDRRTQDAQERVRKSIKGRSRWFLAVAIQEIEAWWLGDRDQLLNWAGLREETLPGGCRFAGKRYRAEKDDDPKRTLNELTEISDRFDRFYGRGSTALAMDFVESYWRDGAADIDRIKGQCPKGFDNFETKLVTRFRRRR